jgi:uncharacterized protein (DUF1015 family)
MLTEFALPVQHESTGSRFFCLLVLPGFLCYKDGNSLHLDGGFLGGSMADLKPFRGWRYNSDLVPDTAAVLAPPYDVIDAAQQRRLYQRHPHNVVRLILGEIRPEDTETDNRYTRAAAYLNRWQREGVLQQDGKPAFYLYQQAFRDPNGEHRVRRGLVALLRLEPLGGGTVFPHEETFPKQRLDRLRLLRSCRAHFNPIFSFFPDADGEVRQLLTPPSERSDVHLLDDEDVVHDLWVLRDPAQIQAIEQATKSPPIYIADGHHRYETCLRYEEEQESAPGRRGPDAAHHWTLMYFTPMEGEGLVILPTHKMVGGIKGFDQDAFLKGVNRDFVCREIPCNNDGPRAREHFVQLLRTEGNRAPAIGLVVRGAPVYRILSPRQPDELGRHLSYIPQCLRGLDVTLLHEWIFRKHLQIDITDPQDANLSYSHDLGRAVQEVRAGAAQLAFIMNPTRIEELRAVARAGCKMPQKATYFYPKLLSGLVINTMG